MKNKYTLWLRNRQFLNIVKNSLNKDITIFSALKSFTLFYVNYHNLVECPLPNCMALHNLELIDRNRDKMTYIQMC